MWLTNHLRTLLKMCALLLLFIVTLVPQTHRVLFENRIFTQIDNASTQYIDDALLRAASAYALSRSFNAVVSVFEESHLQFQPAGLGISLAIGEILDPINDLVERFSWVMLASLTSLGIQKALVVIGPWFSLTILLPIAIGLLGIALIPLSHWSRRISHLGQAILISVILVRFAVPVMAYLNQQVYVSVLEETHNEAIGKVSREMDKLKKEMPDMTEPHQKPDIHQHQNLWDKTKEALNRTLDQSKDMVDIQDRVDKLTKIATGVIDRLVDLIVVFVLNTIVMPLLFLWAIARLGRKINTWDHSARQS